MLIRKRRLGIPSESRESFAILTREQLLEPSLGARLQKMAGFRNLANSTGWTAYHYLVSRAGLI